MTTETIQSIMQQAIIIIILLSAPMLLIGLTVGLIVSIFQATTQIQEATLAFVPKILAVLLSLVVFGPWMMNTIVDYTTELFLSINTFVQ